jgi:hypothetical protein
MTRDVSRAHIGGFQCVVYGIALIPIFQFSFLCADEHMNKTSDV